MVILFAIGSFVLVKLYEHIDEDRRAVIWRFMNTRLSGSVGLIRSRIDHRDLRGIDSYFKKHNENAAWEARRIFHHIHHPNAQSSWSLRQNFKYRLITSPWGGLVFFLGSFFVMGGWRDGSIGFAFCLFKAGYFTQIACRLRELEQQPNQLQSYL